MMTPTFRSFFLVSLLLALAACSSQVPVATGPSGEQDSAPSQILDWHNIPDAEPKWEPRARYGNHSPYKVFGKTYHVLPSSKGYNEVGIGSWYGKKFAGRPTSSQEPYDPYAMTAAHKSLPLPSYVRVTNLDNNKQIVVRVNDRGPFHEGRIIDLSYAAAHKIGYANKGTARVKVEVIELEREAITRPTRPAKYVAPVNGNKQSYYLQVGAFQDLSTAKNLRLQLIALTAAPVGIYSQSDARESAIHRVRIGPFASENAAQQVQYELRETVSDPLLIKR
ncbi:septal ring lytic transglycosylase RlpA family protein [Ketobacter sp.]